MEDNNCPKPNCGRPESTHRYSAGKKLSICGNGHSWDAGEVAAQRAKAREAEARENGIFDVPIFSYITPFPKRFSGE
jgi:hypothetical protein